MKMFNRFILVSTIGISLLATVTALASVQIRDFKIDDVRFRKIQLHGQSFSEAFLTGVAPSQLGVSGEIGAPRIPVIRFYATGEVSVQLGPQISKAQLPLTAGPLVPVQPSQPKVRGAQPPLALNSAQYAQNTFSPTVPYTIENAGSLHGLARKLITLYPFAYNPAQRTYVFRKDFRVTERSVDPMNPTSNHRLSTFAFVVGEQFQNDPALAEYAELKRLLGFEVKTIVVGKDASTPYEIRAQLQALYRDPRLDLQFALLIGDVEDVPALRAHYINGVTDHFYRVLDQDSYDNDINGPDIGVGRVSAANPEQLAQMLAKYTRYTRGEFASEDWLENWAWIATDDRYEVAEASHNYAIETYAAPSGYKGFFPNPTQPGGDRLYAVTHHATGPQAVSFMNQGRALIQYSGHGSSVEWVGPQVSQDDVRSLDHPAALPFVTGNACITGNFSRSESFAETWSRHPRGAIAYWGSVDNTFWTEDDLLERAEHDGLFRDGRLEFTSMTEYALGELWRFFGGQKKSQYYWETYTLFGDPSLHLRTGRTIPLTIEGPSWVPPNSASTVYTIRNKDTGRAIPFAKCSLSSVDRSLTQVFTGNSNGEVSLSFPITASLGDHFTLVATAPNSRWSSRDVEIRAPSEPFIDISGITLNGRPTPTASAAETVGFGLTLKNLGQAGTQGARLWIASVTGPAVPTSASAIEVPPLAPAEQWSTDSDSLQIRIDTDAAEAQVLTVRFGWETGAGTQGVIARSLQITRGQIRISAVDFGALGGINPGDTADAFLTLKNSGSETIRNAVLRPTAGACIAGITGKIQVTELLPGAELTPSTPLRISVMPDCKIWETAAFSIQGDYESIVSRLELKGETQFSIGRLVDFEMSATHLNLPIPDNGAPLEQPFEVKEEGLLDGVGITLGLRHPFLNDILVTLRAPSGQEVTVYNGRTDRSKNLDDTFGLGGIDVPALAELKNTRIQGIWSVRVQDRDAGDSGNLDTVKIRIRGFKTPPI